MPTWRTYSSGTTGQCARRRASLGTSRTFTGCERAAAMYRLIETAKLNGINPQAWLADVLARPPDHPAKRLDELPRWSRKMARAPVAA